MKCLVRSCLLSLSLVTAFAHAELISNVPLDVSRFERMDASTLAHHAQSGNSHAQFFLAKRLQHGENMVADAKTAAFWYEKAAAQNAAPAMLNLGIMHLKGEGVTADKQKARMWLERAAHLGENRASFALAILDEREQRLVDAYKWYDLSARDAMLKDNIKTAAKNKIGQLALNLSSSDIAQAKARADAWFLNQ